MIQRFDGKVTQAVSKKTSYDVVRWDPGESKLSMAHCNSQLKRGGKKNHGHKHIGKLARNENFPRWFIKGVFFFFFFFFFFPQQHKLIFLAVEVIMCFFVKSPFLKLV